MKRTLPWCYWQTLPFEEASKRQEEFRDTLLNKTRKTGALFLVEHPPTISCGRGEKGNNLLLKASEFHNRGFAVAHTNRGGKVTYHGPGQLVAYPIVNVEEFAIGVKDYVHHLEETMIHFLAKYGLRAERREGYPGAWIASRKIGSIGIHVRKKVSIHGLALNINPDLSHFQVITACGLSGVETTSMMREGVSLSVRDAIGPFVDSFSTIFKCEMDSWKDDV
jgi:lipoyl(octanoyl) transferase